MGWFEEVVEVDVVFITESGRILKRDKKTTKQIEKITEAQVFRIRDEVVEYTAAHIHKTDHTILVILKQIVDETVDETYYL